MDAFSPFQLWLLMGAVAYAGFLFGRATANRDGPRESREERKMREAHDAERTFSGLPASIQEDVDRLLRDGKTIEAIKVIREAAGIGLKDAKITADARAASIRSE